MQTRSSGLRGHGVFRESELGDYFSLDKMFLDNALQYFGRAGVVPNTLGVNDRDGPSKTNAQAIGFGSVHQGFRSGKLQILQSLFKVFPGFDPILLWSTLRFSLIRAEENVASVLFQAQRTGHGMQLFIHAAVISWCLRLACSLNAEGDDSLATIWRLGQSRPGSVRFAPGSRQGCRLCSWVEACSRPGPRGERHFESTHCPHCLQAQPLYRLRRP